MHTVRRYQLTGSGMSVLVHSLLNRRRPVYQKVVRLSTSCLSKRLESSVKILAVVSRANASTASLDVAVATQDYDTENRPKFIEGKEIRYYHDMMERSPLYKPTIFNEYDIQSVLRKVPSESSLFVEKTDWSGDTAADVLEAFKNMAAHAVHNDLNITDPKFEPLCGAISSRLNEYSDEELLEIGKLISCSSNSTIGSNIPHYRDLIKAVNDSWVRRYREWFRSKDLPNVLKAADISYWMRNGSRGYLRCMVYHMALKVQEPHHLLQLTFYLGLLKPLPTSYKCYDIEKRIFSFRQNYSVAELAIFVHAIFRIKSRLQYYPLLEHLLIESLKKFSSLDNYMLVTLSKGCGCAPQSLKPLLTVFQQKVLSKIDDFRIETIIHVLWMCCSNNSMDEEFAQAVYERALKNMAIIRWKELSRLIVMFAEHPSPSRDAKHLSECIIAEMTGRADVKEWIAKKAYILGAVLHRFLLCGHCPHDLLDFYLGWANSLTSNTRGITGKEALALDVHLEVFYPEYEGIRLTKEIRKEICEERFSTKSKEFKNSDGSKGVRSDFNSGAAKRMYSDMLSIVGSVKDNIHLKQLVPSFGYLDYLLCLSKDGTYLPIPRQIIDCEPWNLPHIPKDNLKNGDKFIAITFFQTEAEFSSRKIVCLQREKAQILKKLGYLHIEVAIENLVSATPAYKQSVLEDIIANKLSEECET